MTPPHPVSRARSQDGIAERLRRAREERGWSLHEVSLKTKIPLRHLEIIESGRGQELPDGFIGKSFVRQYAATLGFDGEQAVREFVAQSGLTVEVAFEERQVSPYTPESIQKFHAKVWRNIGIGAIAVLLVILTVAYFVSQSEEAPDPAEPSASRPLPAYRQPETGAPGSNSGAPAASTATSPGALPASGPAAATKPTSPRGSATAPPGSLPGNPAAAAPQQPAPPAPATASPQSSTPAEPMSLTPPTGP